MNKRNSTIELLRFMFALAVVSLHSENILSSEQNTIMRSGRLGVEFFFIVSGYFMAKSVSRSYGKENDIVKDTMAFLKRKILAIMPNYYVAWIICFGVYQYVNRSSLANMFIGAIKAIPELLLIHQSGIRLNVYNGPTWYISSMLIAMYILYPIMKKYNGVFNNIIAPIMFLLLAGYMFQTFGRVTKPSSWSIIMFRGTIRAITELIAGVISYNISEWVKKYKFTKLSKIIFTILEVSMYISIFVFMWFFKASQMDFIILIVLMAAVTLTMSNVTYSNNIFNCKLSYWLGELSLSLYLGHSCIYNNHDVLLPLDWGYYNRITAYLIYAILIGIFIMYTCKLLRCIWKKYLINIKKYFLVC